MDPPSEDDRGTGRKEKRYDVQHQGLPPPAASWPVANRASRNPQTTSHIGSPADLPIAALGFDEDVEVLLPGRGASFFVRVAGRELAASNGVAVLIHGGGFTGMSWAPAADLMKRDCCVLAPDLRGHGLTASIPPADGVDGDLDNPIGDGKNDMMSLDSLAEDVTSLLVEIFSSGLLLRKQPRPSSETEDGGTEGPAAVACSARGSVATLHRGAVEVPEEAIATAVAAAAAVASEVAAPIAADSKVEVSVPQEPVAEESDEDTARESALHRGAE
ncbi:unnamed protein product, partial [Laminaria digitata]